MSHITIHWTARCDPETKSYTPLWRIEPAPALNVIDLEVPPERVEQAFELTRHAIDTLENVCEADTERDSILDVAHTEALKLALTEGMYPEILAAEEEDRYTFAPQVDPSRSPGIMICPWLSEAGIRFRLESMSGSDWLQVSSNNQQTKTAAVEREAAQILHPLVFSKLAQWREHGTAPSRLTSPSFTDDAEVPHNLQQIVQQAIAEYFKYPRAPSASDLAGIQLEYRRSSSDHRAGQATWEPFALARNASSLSQADDPQTAVDRPYIAHSWAEPSRPSPSPSPSNILRAYPVPAHPLLSYGWSPSEVGPHPPSEFVLPEHNTEVWATGPSLTAWRPGGLASQGPLRALSLSVSATPAFPATGEPVISPSIAADTVVQEVTSFTVHHSAASTAEAALGAAPTPASGDLSEASAAKQSSKRPVTAVELPTSILGGTEQKGPNTSAAQKAADPEVTARNDLPKPVRDYVAQSSSESATASDISGTTNPPKTGSSYAATTPQTSSRSRRGWMVLRRKKP